MVAAEVAVPVLTLFSLFRFEVDWMGGGGDTESIMITSLGTPFLIVCAVRCDAVVVVGCVDCTGLCLA